jgi:ketosteroid isomerase-like protein
MRGANVEDERRTVMEVIQLYLYAYAKKDIQGCMKLIARESPLLMLGTNDDEVLSDRIGLEEAFQKDFSMMNNIDFGEFRNQYIEAYGQLASVIVELPISYESGGQQNQTLFRYALTLTKERDQWKICAGMASVPSKRGTYSF